MAAADFPWSLSSPSSSNFPSQGFLLFPFPFPSLLVQQTRALRPRRQAHVRGKANCLWKETAFRWGLGNAFLSRVGRADARRVQGAGCLWAVEVGALLGRVIWVGLNATMNLSLLGWPGPRCTGASLNRGGLRTRFWGAWPHQQLGSLLRASSKEKQQMRLSNNLKKPHVCRFCSSWGTLATPMPAGRTPQQGPGLPGGLWRASMMLS